MGDQDPASSLSRRTLLAGGIAALTATAAATLPLAEEDAEALRPFNYPSGGHGDWWPSYVAHAGTPARPDRHYHYIRDQLVVAQDDLSGLRKGLRRRAGVEVGRSLDELGLALVQLRRPHALVPELVDELHQGRDPAALWAGPNEVLAQCIGRLGGEDRMPTGKFTGWAHWSGTSFTAPVVAAEIAVAIAQGRSGPEAVRHVLHAPGAVRVENLGTVVP
jgi:hypothetical protein